LPVYEIRWSRKAVSYLKRLELATRKLIVEAVEALAANPSNPNMDVKPLQCRPGEFRLRVGDYRIIFEPEKRFFLISVIAIRPRDDVYRR
jgi:mRNA interferase RelE/StbE